MELNYILSESTVQQPEFEIGITTVYFRRNFRQVEHPGLTEGEEPTLYWVYEEAALTKDQAINYLMAQNRSLENAQADSDALSIDHEYRLTMLEQNLN